MLCPTTILYSNSSIPAISTRTYTKYSTGIPNRNRRSFQMYDIPQRTIASKETV